MMQMVEAGLMVFKPFRVYGACFPLLLLEKLKNINMEEEKIIVKKKIGKEEK